MKQFPIFLSVVVSARNQAGELDSILRDLSVTIAPLVDDYELIVVDNGSVDDTIEVLSDLTGQAGLPNLQVYSLTRAVDSDTVAWVGLENALGDFVAVIDPMFDEIRFLPNMLDRAVEGNDIVFALNERKRPRKLAYRAFRAAFNVLYSTLHHVHLSKDASQYRLLSKRVVNFILQNPLPATTYRRLPAITGFKATTLRYSSEPRSTQPARLSESFDQSLRLLVSTSRLPMRIATVAFCAIASVSVATSVVNVIRLSAKKQSVDVAIISAKMSFLSSLIQSYSLPSPSTFFKRPAFRPMGRRTTSQWS